MLITPSLPHFCRVEQSFSLISQTRNKGTRELNNSHKMPQEACGRTQDLHELWALVWEWCKRVLVQIVVSPNLCKKRHKHWSLPPNTAVSISGYLPLLFLTLCSEVPPASVSQTLLQSILYAQCHPLRGTDTLALTKGTRVLPSLVSGKCPLSRLSACRHLWVLSSEKRIQYSVFPCYRKPPVLSCHRVSTKSNASLIESHRKGLVSPCSKAAKPGTHPSSHS